MNNIELDEINRLPEKYRPMGAWSYFGYQILFSIPLIGFIALLVCAFSDTNINRRSFARSYFCVLIIAIIIAVILVVALGGCAAIAGAFN